MKVLLTGGAGYVGSVLTTKLLNIGHEVDVLDNLIFGGSSILPHFYNPNFRLIHGSIALLKKDFISRYDAVLHLASIVFTHGEYMENQIHDINYECTKNLVDMAKDNNVKFIFSSTCSNYGVNNKADETSPLNPTNAYARSKTKAEQYILNHYPPAVILRLSTVFGLSPKMRFDTTINEFVLNAVATSYLNIYNYDSWRPYIHIDDATNAFLFFLERKKSGVYNIGDDKLNLTKRNVCDTIKKYIPSLNVELQKEINEPRDYKVSFKKLKKTGFLVRRTVDEGIHEIKQAIENHMFMDPFDDIHNNFKTYKKYYLV